MFYGTVHALHVACLLFSLGCHTAQPGSAFDERVAQSVRSVLAEAPTRRVGVVAVDAIATRTRTRLQWFGTQTSDAGTQIDDETQFELGSVSKVFAALLLTDAERRGEVALDEPIGEHLPGWKLPEQAGHKLSFRHALTHTLGIADMMPSNWTPVDKARGITTYSDAMFRAYLESYTLASIPGERYAYTNIGSSLIALALRHRTGKAYAALLRERIFQPLGMQHSDYADVPPKDPARLLDGYQEDEAPFAQRIDVSPIGPSCVIRSTLRDMGRFIQAALHADSALTPAFARAAEREPNVFNDGQPVALGWNVDASRDLLRRNGQVAGYRTNLVLSPDTGKGMFVIVSSMRTDINALSEAVMGALWPELAKR